MTRRPPVTFDLLRQLERRELVQARWSFGKVDVQHPVYSRAFAKFFILVKHQHIREPSRRAMLHDLFDLIIPSRVVIRVRDHREQILQKLEHVPARLSARRYDNFRRRRLTEIRRKLILCVLFDHVHVV